MSAASYLAFCGLCILLTLTPGPDTFLTLRFGMRRKDRGIAAGVGSSLGVMVWAVLVGVGLAALVEQSAEAYRILKFVGGAYLLYLGVQAFRAARATSGAPHPETEPKGSLLSAFGAGVVSCVLNPKVGLFFLAVVPQFLPAGSADFGYTMLLGATDAVLSVIYLSALALVAAKANEWLKRPRVTRNLERISGGVLAALGIGTAASAATG